MIMDISLDKLSFEFSKKPILVGGKAMEFYSLRKAGHDIDFVASEEDIRELIKRYPDRVKDISGDLGVCPLEFEFWKTIRFLNYEDLKEDAIQKDDYLIISLEKLLLLKVLAIDEEKYLQDTKLIVSELNNEKRSEYQEMKIHNDHLLEGIKNVVYLEQVELLEKTG